MIGWMEPCSSLQRTWDFFSKKIINSLSPQINEILPKPKLDVHAQTFICSLTLLWVLSNSLTLVRDLSYSHDQDHVHVHSHAILLPHWKIARISIHSQNKTPSSIMSLSPRLSSRIWAIQKEIKDAYPKKVCHMPKRHVKNDIKKKR